MGILRDDQPVTGKDLDDLRHSLSLTVADMCWLFGMSMNKWSSVVRKGALKPVPDESIEILARLLDAHPEHSPLARMPQAAEFHKFLNQVEKVDKKRLSALMGREASAGYRWLEKGVRIPATLQHIAYVITEMMRHRDLPAQRKKLAEWEKLVRRVSSARGVQEDVFGTGTWKSGSRTPRRK